MMAISAVDCALWDLRGKHLRPAGLPPARRPDARRASPATPRCSATRSTPAWCASAPRRWSRRASRPRSGSSATARATASKGMERNVALVRTVREAVGPNVEIMFDCFMGWDMTYAIRLLERIAEYHPRWLEEPVPPDRIDDFAPIRRATRVPDRHRRARVHPLGLPAAAAGRRDRRDPGRPRLVRRHQRAGQDRARSPRRSAGTVIPHGHSDPRRRARHRRAAAGGLPDGRVPAARPAGSAALPHAHDAPEQRLDRPADAPGLGLEIDAAKVEARQDLD